MPRFFVQAEQISDGYISIKGDDAHHISHSLRMAVGEHITVCDMQMYEYECVLDSFSSDVVGARVIERKKIDTEPPYRAHLYQALPKGDKLDSVIQKAVECGVYDITPFESSRCIVRAKPEAEEKKTERRLRIAAEAAKQSGRGILPAVYPTVSFSRMLDCIAHADVILFCYEGDGTLPLGKALADTLRPIYESNKDACPDIAVIIGSEGGFSLDEVEKAKAVGAVPIGLGRRILRTETASGFVLSCLVYETELSF